MLYINLLILIRK